MSTTVEEAPPVSAQPPAPPLGPSPGFTPDIMVEKFVALRDKVAEIKKRHSEELAKYNLAMGTLEAWLLDALNKAGVDSMRAPKGTFYKTTHSSVTVNRWSQTLEYIQEHEAWELLEARVSKTAVEAIIADTGQSIPGVVISRATSLNVRRA